jgi:hypothetical protein
VTIATSIVARTRFGSLKVTALCELDPPQEAAEIDRKIAAPLAREDGSHNAPSHQREWLTESADRSIARRAEQPLRSATYWDATSALTNSAFS